MNTQLLERTDRYETVFTPKAKALTSFKMLEREKKYGTATLPVILVVEDDELIRDIVVEVLRGSGFDCLQAGSAEDAMEYIVDDGQQVDLMIADVHLPGRDGHEMVENARDYRPNLKVIYVTGSPTDHFLKNDYKNRNTDLITKPFGLREVREHVTAML